MPTPSTIIPRPSQPAQSTAADRPFSLRNLIVRFLSMLFLASLFVPLIGAWRHWDFATASNENRRLAESPPVPGDFKDAAHFSDRWLGFYRDHFGLRNTLIRAVSETRYHGFGADTGESYIIGKDGWLFFRPEADHNFMGYRGLNPFSEDELNAWQDLLETRRAWLASKGIQYFVVIPPDKQTIYPEYLPPEYAVVRHESRLDQLIGRLAQTHSPVHLVDLRPALLEAKKFHRLYFKTDTHWDDYGGFAAYPVILNAVNQFFPAAKMVPQSLSNFVPRSTIHAGDLSHLTNLYYDYAEDWPQLIRRTPAPSIMNPDNPYMPVTNLGEDPHAPSLYIVHDSYALYLSQFLGPHFSRVCWAWSQSLNGPWVLNFKPDLVIDEFLERMLYAPPPVDTPDVRAPEPR